MNETKTFYLIHLHVCNGLISDSVLGRYIDETNYGAGNFCVGWP